MTDFVECKYCGRMLHPKGMGPHMTAHRAEIEAEEKQNAMQQVEAPKIPRWRLQTPVFGPGQVGVRIPRHKLEKGWK